MRKTRLEKIQKIIFPLNGKNCSNSGNNDAIATFVWTVMSTLAELVAVCPSHSDKQTPRFGLRPLLQNPHTFTTHRCCYGYQLKQILLSGTSNKRAFWEGNSWCGGPLRARAHKTEQRSDWPEQPWHSHTVKQNDPPKKQISFLPTYINWDLKAKDLKKILKKKKGQFFFLWETVCTSSGLHKKCMRRQCFINLD